MVKVIINNSKSFCAAGKQVISEKHVCPLYRRWDPNISIKCTSISKYSYGPITISYPQISLSKESIEIKVVEELKVF